MKALTKFFNCRDGTTAIEYALIAFLMAVLIVFGVTIIGTAVTVLFNKVAGAVESVF